MASVSIQRTPGVTGNRKTWTWSAWIKRGLMGATETMMGHYTDSDNRVDIGFMAVDTLYIYEREGASTKIDFQTTRVFRDTSAWYHFVVAVDTAQSVEADRMKFYVNGTQITDWIDDNYPAEDLLTSMNYSGNTMTIGGRSSNYFSGEMSHVQWVDGAALAPTEFGEVDSTSGIWKIKTTAYATPGTNGFFLKMEDRTNLDLDSSSNALTFTTSGTLTATYDNPSNNFCTWNPLGTRTDNVPTFSNGNTTAKNTAAAWGSIGGTLIAKSGKWYYEVIGGNTTGPGYMHYGFASTDYFARGGASYGYMGEPGTGINFPSYTYYGYNGNIYYNTTTSNSQTSSYGATYVNTDYIGVFLDLDNSKMYWSKNGTIQNSGTGMTIDNANSDFWTPITGNYTDATGHDTNFGNGVFGTTALTGTTYSDANSKGTFKYSPNDSGGSSFDGSAKDFYALITSNIKLYG